MVMIDHTFFPHIIDALWARMDFDSVLAARTTSKEWLRRGNKRLRRHMLLQPPDQYDESSSDDVSTVIDSQNIRPRRLSETDIDTLRHPPAPGTLCEVLQDVEVLDVRFSPELYQFFVSYDVLLWHAQKRAIIRVNLMQHTPGVVPETTVGGMGGTQVYFVHLQSSIDIRALVPETVILNLNCQEDSPGFSYRHSRLEVSPGGLDKSRVVLIIQNGFPSRYFRDEHVMFLWSWTRIDCRTVDVTVVASEDLYDTEADLRIFKQRICQQVLGTRGRTSIAPPRILTPAEYKAEVGAEKYKIYTEW